MNLLKRKEVSNQITASVSDGYLVLSLPHAIEPVIWRQSLEKIGSATFEVKQGKDDSYELTLKKTKTTSEAIASFDKKDDAIEALTAASNALHSKKSVKTTKVKEKTAKKSSDVEELPKTESGEGQKWLIAVLAAIIVIGLYFYLTTLIPERNIGIGTTNNAVTNAQPNNPNQTGVPVSADDFLSSF